MDGRLTRAGFTCPVREGVEEQEGTGSSSPLGWRVEEEKVGVAKPEASEPSRTRSTDRTYRGREGGGVSQTFGLRFKTNFKMSSPQSTSAAHSPPSVAHSPRLRPTDCGLWFVVCDISAPCLSEIVTDLHGRDVGVADQSVHVLHLGQVLL